MKKYFKFVVPSIAILIGICVIPNAFVGGFLMLLAGVIALPPISNIIRNKYALWSNKVVAIATPIALFVIGIGVSTSAGNESYSKQPKTVISEYVTNDTLNPAIKLSKQLIEAAEIFGNENYAFESITADWFSNISYDSIAKVHNFIFTPLNSEVLDGNTTFLSNYKQYGKLKEYSIQYKMDGKGAISHTSTKIKFDKKVIEFKNETLPDYNQIVNQKVVDIQIEDNRVQAIAAAKNKKDRAEYNKRATAFEESCLSNYDGSHRELKKYRKQRLNDPSSFKHVNTGYRLIGGKEQAVISMTYRGTNKFGAVVTNSIKAKVSLVDCSIIEIVQ